MCYTTLNFALQYSSHVTHLSRLAFLGVHTLKFADCHVDWYSLDEIYLYVESAASYIRQKLGLQKGN